MAKPFTVHPSPFTLHRSPFPVHLSPFTFHLTNLKTLCKTNPPSGSKSCKSSSPCLRQSPLLLACSRACNESTEYNCHPGCAHRMRIKTVRRSSPVYRGRGPRSGDGVQNTRRTVKTINDLLFSTPSPPRRSPPPINRGRAPSGFNTPHGLLTPNYFLSLNSN